MAVDGKVVWAAEHVKAAGPRGKAPEAVVVPIKGARQVELRAESPGKMDVLGRVDWVNAALVRP